MRVHWNWGTGMVVTYAAFAMSTAGFVLFAMGHEEALVSPDYYAHELQYDQRMTADANAQALGASVTCSVADDGRTVSLQFPADQTSAHGTVTLYRASDAGADRRVPLSLDAGGAGTVSLAGLAAGRWRLQVEWVTGGRPYYFERVVDAR